MALGSNEFYALQGLIHLIMHGLLNRQYLPALPLR